MAKIVLSDELKKKIAETTGLTYLASNIEKFDDSEGKFVNELLNFYAPQRKMLEDVNVNIKEEIMKEVPNLKMEIQVPGEGGLTKPEGSDEGGEDPKPEMVTLTITADPSDAVVKINGEEKSGIEVEKGTSVTYTVEKEGYKKVEETIVLNENKVIEVTLEAEEKVAPTITSNAPSQMQVNENIEYEVSTTPGDYAGEMVYVEVEAGIEPEKINTIEYWEPNTDTPKWMTLPKNDDGKYYFGVPSVGFPLQAASSKFRLNINTAGEYTSTMRVIKVADSSVLCTASSTVTVVEAPQEEVLSEETPVEETVAEETEHAAAEQASAAKATRASRRK